MKVIGETLTVLIVVWVMGPAAGIVDAALVAYWDLDDMNGRVVTDRCGDNDGIVRGNPEWVKGHSGHALDLDGDGDHVFIAHDNLFNITRKMTVTCWMRVRKWHATYAPIVTMGSHVWKLQRNERTNTVRFYCGGLTGDTRVVGSADITDDTWHHVAGVYDGEGLYLYIDGVLEDSVATSGRI